MARKIAFGLSMAVLLFTGFVGIYNALTEWNGGPTPMQRAVTVGVFLYGVFGLISAYGLARRRKWALGPTIVWSVCVIYVSGLAVMADADKDTTLGSAIAASAASTLIALGILWAVKVWTRDDPKSTAQIAG